MYKVELYGLSLPEVQAGDDLIGLLLNATMKEGIEVKDQDILVITSKIVSKALGLLIDIRSVKPSEKAFKISGKSSSDPRFIELLLRESDGFVAAVPFKRLVEKGIINARALSKDINKVFKAAEFYPTVFITRRDGMVWSESGLDTSNHPENIYSIPARRLDEVAMKISKSIYNRIGRRVAVIIADTEMFPWGAMDVARGSYGIDPIKREFGEPDAYGKPKFGGVDNIAFSLCAAASLLMGQRGEGVPAVLIRGIRYEWHEGGLKDSLIKLGLMKKTLIETFKHTVKVLGLTHVLSIIIKVFWGDL